MSPRQDSTLDHFLVYRLERPPRATIWLKGQFDERPVPTGLGRMVRLANPTNKLHPEAKQELTRIADERNHLTWYRVRRKGREPERLVDVENQFGRARWRLGDPRFLLVPAHKEGHEPPAPEGLDHFLCYEVLEGRPVDVDVELWDQFIEERTPFKVGLPRLLGVPVTKSHEQVDQLEVPGPERQHLAIYRIGRTPHRSTVWIDDQFHAERETVTTEESLLLSVPSRKELVHVE